MPVEELHDAHRQETVEPPERYGTVIRQFTSNLAATLCKIVIDGWYEIQRVGKTLPPGVDLERIATEDRESAYVTFYDVLNGLNNRKNVDVYVTGSNSKMLSSDIATVFRGRSTEIRVWPLSFAEVFAAQGGDKADAWEKYLVFGGMPQAVLETDERESARILRSLFD